MPETVTIPRVEEYLAEATRGVAGGLALNRGANWDDKQWDEIVGHLMKVARVLDACEGRRI